MLKTKRQKHTKNIKTMTFKLLKDLNFAEKLNAHEAVTESGKDFLKNYRGYMFQNAATCSIVNNFIKEAKAYAYDKGLMNILESVVNFVNENNISWRLSTVCENISNNNSSYNNLAKFSLGKVEKLLEMKESDVVSYIKAGVLKDVTYVREFREIAKDVYKNQSVSEAQTLAYEMTTPVSYAFVDENKAQFVNVFGKTFCINEGKVSEATCEDPTFNKINAHLSAMKLVGESLVYDFKTSVYENESYHFEVTNEALKLTKGNKINESFDTPVAFRQYADTCCRIMNANERMQFMSICEAIAEVFENMDNIVSVDCAKLFKGSNGSISAVIECQDNVCFVNFHKYGVVESLGTFDSMVEALKLMESTTKIDVKNIYESRIVADMKKERPDDVAQIEEQLEKENRLKKIQQLAESLKNDPAAIALLNTLAQELNK